MKLVLISAASILAIVASLRAADVSTSTRPSTYPSTPDVLNFTMKSLAGQDVDLGQYKGKVLLIVNVASKCGNTPQYKPLEAMHEKYQDKGLAILGFPCNQFHAQEPGSDEEISTFCTKNYGVKFDMFSKIEVNGPGATPIYQYLTSHAPRTGPITWNFEKFVISREGKIVARFDPKIQPDSKEVLAVIDAELAK